MPLVSARGKAAQRGLLALGLTVGLVATSLGAANASSVPGSSLNAAGPTKNIIIMLKNQHADLAVGKGHTSARVAANRRDQAPLIANAKTKGARNVHGFDTINAYSATVTSAELSALLANPAVAGAFPDRPIATAPVTKETPEKASSAPVHNPVCPSDPAKPLLEPEALGVTNTAFDDQTKASAQKIVDGTGVKVAYIADGIDINNPDFVRANGEHVFIDYKDFSGDGVNAVTGGAEAFGDASSIAAQGRQVYDLADFAAVPTPTGCNIRVLGVAPGASLIGLKVFGNSNSAPTSRFIEAIDYAVAAGADVLNESFGGNPYPDNGNDPITLADRAAVAAGVTVVASTGDAGVTGTIGSPSSSPDVIAVGATTTFQSYLQTDAAGARQFSNGTWLNNNISAISSGGVTQGNTVPDLVAPGDLGWALCTPDLDRYEECAADNGSPSGIQNFGGTSQSSPLTAGAAALVIEAYENTHHGVRPAPSLVKRILTGTAQDLGAPGYEQGAGLLNSLAAVKVAESWVDPNGGQAQVGSALVANHNQVSLSGAPGSTQTGYVTIRNVSPSTQVVKATTRAYDHVVKDTKGSIHFNVQTAPAFIDEGLVARGYVTKTFTVGSVDRLDVSAAAAIAAIDVPWSLRLTLIDPSGAFAAYNIPQGGANYAHVDVRKPKAGTWTMIISSSKGSAPTLNLFKGKVAFEIIQTDAATHGSVSPSSMSLRPGQTGTFRVSTKMPSAPGDLSASVQLSDATASTSIPLNLRAIIPAKDTTFSGKITGGNGRSSGGVAQSNIYYMDVPAGKKDLSIGITFSDPGQVELATLTAPDGQVLSFQSNDPFGDALQMYRRNPKPGRWILSLESTNPVSGLETTQSFTVKVKYNTVKITAKGLPTSASTKLAAGQPVTVPVTVTNTGNNAMFYFTDGRLDQTGTIALADIGFQFDDAGNQVPIVEPMPLPQPDTTLPLWFVPTEVSQFGVTAAGDQPVNLDVNYQSGEPEVYGPAVGNTATITSTGDQVSPTFWLANVGQTGPFDGPATPGEVSFSATATGQLFDPAIGSVDNLVFDPNFIGFAGQSADARRTALLKQFGQRLDGKNTRSTLSGNGTAATTSAPVQVDPTSGLLILFPGETGVIDVTITPDAAPGTVVQGHLYVDSFGALFTDGIDELIDLPYTYTVK
jgi:hypothetical protein